MTLFWIVKFLSVYSIYKIDEGSQSEEKSESDEVLKVGYRGTISL